MDIICPKCGEPIDVYELHEIAWSDADPKSTRNGYMPYKMAYRLFKTKGCGALGFSCNPNKEFQNSERGAMVEALYDLLGDDVDGIAAEIEDFDLWGGEK